MKLIKEPEQSTRVCSTGSTAAGPPATGHVHGEPTDSSREESLGTSPGGSAGQGGRQVVEVWEEGEDARCEDMESTWSSGN